MPKPKVLVLFAQEWDRLALADPDLAGRYTFVHAGFDLFRFPENARLLAFHTPAYIERMVRMARREGIAAVISPHEQFGLPIAAVIARRLGLPGPEPRAVLAAQHKYYARLAIASRMPEANPPFGVFPFAFRPEALPLPFPFFVKPVKATFSVLARRVDDLAALRRLLSFGRFERYLIERLIRPFDDLLTAHAGFAVDAHHLLAEGLMRGMQVNVDGYASQGRIRILGVVDELMYPGTSAFNRFEYPSSLPKPIRERLAECARQAMRAVGFDHGLFNVELIYDPEEDTIRVVEINPRVASQFVTLYRWVDGIDLYRIMLDLAFGRTPRSRPRRQPFTHAASFVFRKFDGKPVRPVPTRAQLAKVRRRHPDARLMFYLKRGGDLAREMKWLGSHRYAIANLAGTDRADLYARYRDIRDTLGFGPHAGPEPAAMWSTPELPASAGRAHALERQA